MQMPTILILPDIAIFAPFRRISVFDARLLAGFGK
jgi:hypothetical protein